MIDKETSIANRKRHYQNYLELRTQKKIKTDAEMARKTGIYPSSFTDWKQGVSEPKMDKILAIAKVLRVSPNRIID